MATHDQCSVRIVFKIACDICHLSVLNDLNVLNLFLLGVQKEKYSLSQIRLKLFLKWMTLNPNDLAKRHF